VYEHDGERVPLRDPEGPILLGDNDDIVWFARGRVAVGVPTNSTGGRPEAVRHLRQRHAQLGKPLALAILVKYDHDSPTEEIRRDIQHTFDEMSPMLACNAITVLGSGFFKSFFISFVSQILRLTHQNGGSYRILTGLESAASWMHEQLNDPSTSVEDILDTLRWADREAQA
jgi:hypothetical protein